MATVTVNIKVNSADAGIYAAAGNTHKCLKNARNLLKGLDAGATQGSVDIGVSSSDPVAASGTATITYASIAATDTIVIGNTTFTCVASGATGAQFNKVTDATATAASLVAAVNANAAVGQHVLASNVAGVVTITARTKGSIGNQIVMSKTGTGIALVQLAGGTGGPEGTPVTYGR